MLVSASRLAPRREGRGYHRGRQRGCSPHRPSPRRRQLRLDGGAPPGLSL